MICINEKESPKIRILLMAMPAAPIPTDTAHTTRTHAMIPGFIESPCSPYIKGHDSA
ncbi:MAG: hypothetical protein K2N54_01680 [Helicobacter sp.]|nr:hypothetical protein [Helicobacter sp.]